MDIPKGATMAQVRQQGERCLLCAHPMDDHTVIIEERTAYAVTTLHAVGWRCPDA